MRIRNMARCALFAALLCLCAWISLPVAEGAFTLQTLGVLLALGLLGGKWGSISVLVYLLLGVAGAPVFSGFRGGIGVLLGATGGYLAGFFLCALIYWGITAFFGNGKKVQLLAMALGLLGCYAFGTGWFYFGYLGSGSGMGLAAILAKCVLPYLVPDGVKLAVAWLLTQRLKRIV